MEVRCRRLEGKVAVVTAYTQGIGLAIAERLRRRPPGPVCPFVLLNSDWGVPVGCRGTWTRRWRRSRRRGRLPCLRLRRTAALEPH
ncbi:unnamed protein product [Urochloa humidicola]